ncbi:hypothetical protein DMENIID0001_120020 [Sergentomyia squamirostris]
MGENSGGPGPPREFNLNSALHRGEMPSVTEVRKKPYRVLKTSFFTHPSDSEKYFIIGGDAIRSMDVFDIEEGLQAISKEDFKVTTRLASGDILVQTRNIEQLTALQNLTVFGPTQKQEPVTVSENGVLNQSHGIIRCRDIMKIDTNRICEKLAKYKVIKVQRMQRRQGNAFIDTATHVLTFDSPTIPADIKVGLSNYRIEIYIPSPFRCARCHKIGHTRKRCDSNKNKEICGICSEEPHGENPCTSAKCVNCGGPHPSFSKTCPRYLDEREVNAIRTTMRIPYNLAWEELRRRKRSTTVNNRLSQHFSTTTTTRPTYSQTVASSLQQSASTTPPTQQPASTPSTSSQPIHHNTSQSKTQSSNHCLSGLKWGSSRSSLLQIHESVVLSKMFYGSEIYFPAAAKTHLNTLNSVYNTGYRLSSGAFRTSPINSILAEVGVAPLQQRFELICSKNAVRLLANPNIPGHKDLLSYTNIKNGTQSHDTFTDQQLQSEEMEGCSRYSATAAEEDTKVAFVKLEPMTDSEEQLRELGRKLVQIIEAQQQQGIHEEEEEDAEMSGCCSYTFTEIEEETDQRTVVAKMAVTNEDTLNFCGKKPLMDDSTLELKHPEVPVDGASFQKWRCLEDPQCPGRRVHDEVTPEKVQLLHSVHLDHINGNWSLQHGDKTQVLADGGLYERVVPQYNNLIQHYIPKSSNKTHHRFGTKSHRPWITDIHDQNQLSDVEEEEEEEQVMEDDSKKVFREWHETVQKKSYNDEVLTFLPYVVID